MMWDPDDDQIRVNFSISLYGKEQVFNGVYEDSANWHDVLGDVISTLEASYGYSFKISEELGIYYKGKENEC